MFCLLVSYNLYIMQYVFKGKSSKYQYEEKRNCSVWGLISMLIKKKIKFNKSILHIPRKHLPSQTISVFEKTYFKIKIANTGKS